LCLNGDDAGSRLGNFFCSALVAFLTAVTKYQQKQPKGGKQCVSSWFQGISTNHSREGMVD
ncbi:hypothetical protein ACQP3F_31640, partial [Escherichia coli]